MFFSDVRPQVHVGIRWTRLSRRIQFSRTCASSYLRRRSVFTRLIIIRSGRIAEIGMQKLACIVDTVLLAISQAMACDAYLFWDWQIMKRVALHGSVALLAIVSFFRTRGRCCVYVDVFRTSSLDFFFARSSLERFPQTNKKRSSKREDQAWGRVFLQLWLHADFRVWTFEGRVSARSISRSLTILR